VSDDVKTAVDAVRHSIENYHRHGLNSLSLPTLQSLLAHIDGEAARTDLRVRAVVEALAATLKAERDEAVTRAKEEMREACAQYLSRLASDWDSDGGYLERAVTMREASERVSFAPLDATPLAVERRAALDLLGEFSPLGLVKGVREMARSLRERRARAERAETERDELRARIEASCPSPDEGGRIHAGGRIVCGQCHDSEMQHLRNECDDANKRAEKAEAERDDALRAVTHVTAERDFAQSVAKMNHERLMEVVRALRLLDANKGCDCCSGDRFAEACELTSAVLAKHPEGA
jgi:hypothetical protein